MREIIDNAYMFSLAREDVGRIIIDRTNRQSLDGENIFDVLGIAPDELDFFNQELDAMGESCLAIVGQREAPRAIVIFHSMCYSTSTCLAVELDLPVEAVASVIADGAFENIRMSDGLRSKAKRSCGNAELHRVYSYLHGMLSDIFDASLMKNSHVSENPYRLKQIAQGIGDFIGVDVRCDVVSYGSDDPIGLGNVFAGSFLAASMLTVSMMARRCAVDRALDVLIVDRGGAVEVKLSFAGEGIADRILARALRIATSSNVHMGCETYEGVYSFDLYPYYEDVGFIGLKAPNSFTLW